MIRAFPPLAVLSMVILAGPAATGSAAPPDTAVASPAAPTGTAPGTGLDSLPVWRAPAEYHVKMTVTGEPGEAVIDRYISNHRSRMDLVSQGHHMSMIDAGDEAQTYYSLMHEQKMAMKDSWKSIPGGDSLQRRAAPNAAGGAALHATLLGREDLNGRPALKYRIETSEGAATAWFDAALGAPLEMESSQGTVTFSLPEPGTQSPELFEVPKDYQVMDVGAMRAQMSKMMPGGISGMSGLMGGMGGGMPGMGSMGAMARSRLAGMGHGAATQAGGDLGASVGAGLGGPIGAMIGRYIGQRAAGWLADRVGGKLTGSSGMGGPAGLQGRGVSIPGTHH